MKKILKKWMDKRAVSEIIGTLLLLAIAVILFSSLIVYVLSMDDDPAAPSLNLIGRIATDGNAVIEHNGGDTLRLKDTKIILKMGDVETETIMFDGQGNAFNESGSPMGTVIRGGDNGGTDGWWDIGEYFTVNCTELFGDVTYWQISTMVIDIPSNSIIMSGVLQEGIMQTSPPVAMFTWEPPNPKVDKTITFDASESFDPDGGAIQKYEWDFDDGSAPITKYTPITQHPYSKAGTFNVKLTVTDNEGQTATIIAGVGTGAVIIPPTVTENERPFALFSYNSIGNGRIYFDAGQSYDIDGDVDAYHWDFGDGTGLQIFEDPYILRRYSAGGVEYIVTLIVVDNDGAESETASSISIKVPPIKPIVVIDSPSDLSTNKAGTFDASNTYDPDDNTPLTFEWDFNGDGIVDKIGENVEWQFTTAGNHTISLKVTDQTGGVGWLNETVYVRGPIIGRKFLIVDNTPVYVQSGTIRPYRSLEWNGIDNIVDCLNIGNDVYDYGKVLDQHTFYAYYNGTWHNNTVGDPNYDPVDVNESIMAKYDIVIWGNGDFPGDGKWWTYGPKPASPSLPNAWNTPINEGSDDYSNHADKLRNLLDKNGTFLLTGTYSVRDLQEYPGNGASDDEVEFGNRLGLVEPDGGIDESIHDSIDGYFATDTYNPEIRQGTFGYGPVMYPGGILYGVPGTSSEGTETANLVIEGELPIYSVIKQGDSSFKYSMNVTDIPGGGSEVTIFSTSFSSNPFSAGWTQYGTYDEWEWSNGYPSKDGRSYYVCTDKDGFYQNNADCSIETPSIDLTGYSTATLSFLHWQDFENGGDVFVEVSTDGGTSWDPPLATFDEDYSGDWDSYSRDISEYAGKIINIRWHLVVSGYATQDEGYWLDDIEITGMTSGGISGHLAIDAAREGNRSIVLGFDLNSEAINHTSRAQYILNVLQWLAEGVGYPTKIYVDNNKPDGWYDDTHVDNIQEAIERIMVGGTIYVNGTGVAYNGINVHKTVTIIGQNLNGFGYPVIRASGSQAVRVTVDWTYLVNITVTSASTLNKGIYLSGSSSTTIKDCNIHGAEYGIYAQNSNYLNIKSNKLTGNTYNLYLDRSIKSKIVDNEICSGSYGCYLTNSFKNTIELNAIHDNSLYGIYISHSADNDVQNHNQIMGNNYGIYMDASNGNNIVENTINMSSSSGLYFRQSSNCNILTNDINNNSAGIKAEDYSANINIAENNIMYNDEQGIMLTSSNLITITDNHISFNQNSNIELMQSNNNQIMLNDIEHSDYGIYTQASLTNIITDNRLNNNTYGLYGISISATSVSENIFTNFTNAVVLDNSHPSGGNNNISTNEICGGLNGIKLIESYKNIIYDNTMANLTTNSIHLTSFSNNNKISKNTITNTSQGIHVQNGMNNNLSHNMISFIDNYGISLSSADDNTLTDNTIQNTLIGIYLSSGCNSNSITKNKITNAISNGEGIRIQTSDSNSIIDNSLWKNSNGIHLISSGGAGNDIINNTIYANTNHGIWLENSRQTTAGNNELSSNSIYDNDGNGIYVQFSKGNSIVNNINISANIKNGIYLDSSSDNLITCNNVSTNNESGIRLYSSSRTTINNNNISQNGHHGLYLSNSNDGTVQNNNISFNQKHGMYFSSSNDGIVIANQVMENTGNGLHLASCSRTAIESNSISLNQNGIYFSASSEGSSNPIQYNNIYNNINNGVFLDVSDSNHFINNNIWNNSCGINISHSSVNEIKENNISTNVYGINIQDADCISNTMWRNNFIDNTYQANDTSSNEWDDGYPSGGNYWSDFDEPTEGAYDNFSGINQNISNDSDGIVDVPYNIQGGSNQDHYPLMDPVTWP